MHNDFAVRDGVSPRYFFSATRELSAHVYVTLESYFYIHYSGARERRLRKTFLIEEVKVPQTSVFAGHGLVQHAGSRWGGEHFIRYNSYLNVKDRDLPDAISFAYGDSIPMGGKKQQYPLKEVWTSKNVTQMEMW